MLDQFVKASAVTHLTDARYFSAWEVGYIGFDLGPEGVSGVELAAMVEWIQGPELIGELDAGWPIRLENGMVTVEELSSLNLDGFQIEAIFDVEKAKLLKALGKPLFLECTVEGYADLSSIQDTLTAYKGLADQVILNFKKGGVEWQDLLTGQPFAIADLVQLMNEYPIWLEIDGALPSEIAKVLPEVKGFSVRGGSEEKVGFKDFDDLADFFEDVEVEG